MDTDMKQVIVSESLKDKSGQSRSTSYGEFDINYIQLSVDARPGTDTIAGMVKTHFIVTKNILDTLRFDFTSSPFMKIDEVRINNVLQTNFMRSNDQLIIPLTISLSQNQNVISEISYHGNPGKIGVTGSYYYSDISRRGVKAFWTMSEPYGAKYWWPCKMDLYDKADSIDISITHPQEFYAAAPGVLQVRNNIGNGLVTTHWKHRYPIVNYLIAIAVADYKVANSTLSYRGKNLAMTDYIYKTDTLWIPTTKSHLEPTFALFDSLFGSYPFAKEKYGHAQFTRGGGMEHQTMSFMQDLNQPLVAHELAHQWFGNKVTCGSWQDLWLNEGFATYLTALTYEAGIGNRDWMWWKNYSTNIITLEPDGSVWATDTLNFNLLFSSRLTYNKGAYLLHMLRHKLGDDAFFTGVRNYLNDPSLAYGFARTKDLKQHLEATSKQDITEFLADWLYGEGYPNYELTWKMRGNSILLKLEQTQSHSSVSFYEMDVPIAVYKNGKRQDIMFRNTWSGELLSRNIGYMPDSVKVDQDLDILMGAKNVYIGVHQAVSIDEKIGENDFLIYPNPAKDQLNIESLNRSENRIELLVYNQLGKLVLQDKIIMGTDIKELNVSDLNAGVYQLKIIDATQISNYRFIIGE